MTMKLILVRHGKTEKHKKPNGYVLLNGSEGNVHLKGYDVVNGLDETVKKELIEKGKELAAKHPSIDAVFCSALFRTKETVEGIIEGYKQTGASVKTPIPDFRLNERDYGPIFSSIAQGVYADDLYLIEIEKRGLLEGIDLEKLKKIFPDAKGNTALDYLKSIITANGLPCIAVITSYSDLTKAGIETTKQIQDRLTDFENSVSGKNILIGSHGDVMSTWLKKVEEDKTGRYTQETHEALEKRDLTKKKYGNYRIFEHLEEFVVELE